MKIYLKLMFFAVLLSSCNNMANISKEDLCGKEFKDKVEDSMIEGVSFKTSTILRCDGTFESNAYTRFESSSPLYNNSTKSEGHYTGTWSIVKEIPEEVKEAVVKYGLDHNNYSIIKYSSSNGIDGYCLYYQLSQYYTKILAPLYLGQVSMHTYGNEYGALGIFGGDLEE